MKRILLKISGEALGEKGFSAEKAQFLCDEISVALARSPLQLAILIGGGNIWRRRDSLDFGFPQADSDMIGMGATVLNAMVLEELFACKGKEAEIFSPFPFAAAVKPHSVKAEVEALEAGRLVIFAGGTGCPFFTTDSAAVLRALEIRADVVFKGTKVAGIYNSDPKSDPNAEKFDRLTYDEALAKGLKIMDATAFALARENNLPLYVFDAFRPGGIMEALQGKGEGTWVKKSAK